MVAYYCKLSFLVQRKNSAAVFQEYHRLLSGFLGGAGMFLVAKQALRVVKLCDVVEFSEQETRLERTSKRPVDVSRGYLFRFQRFTGGLLYDVLVVSHDFRAVVPADFNERFGVVTVALMVLYILNEVPAIGNCEQQTPLLPRKLEFRRAKLLDSVDFVIACHETERPSVAYRFFERFEVVFMLQPRRDIRVAVYAGVLVVVGVEVLERRNDPHVLFV